MVAGGLATLLLALVTPPCLAQRSLEQVLGGLSTSNAVNFVLAADLDLNQTVPDSVASLPDLAPWLRSRGIEIVTLPNGDLKLSRARRAQIALRALPVTADVMESAAFPMSATSSTTLDSEQLDQLGATQLDQLFVRAANVFGSAEEFYVRGVPSRGDLNTLGNAAAQWGDAPLPDLLLGRLPLTTWDLASAGFERGSRSGEIEAPFSAYAGRILLRPNAPQFADLQRWRLAADHHGSRQVAALINRPLVDQELALRASVDHRSEAGLLHREDGTGTFDSATANTGRIALLWEPAALPASAWELDIALVDGQSGPRRLTTSGNPFDRTGRTDPFDRQQVRVWIGTAALRLETRHGDIWAASAMATDGRSTVKPDRLISNTFDPPFRLVNEEHAQLESLQLRWQRQLADWRLAASVSGGSQRQRETLIRDQRQWRLDHQLSRTSAAVEIGYSIGQRWTVAGRARHSRDRLFRHCISTSVNRDTSDCLESVGLLLIPADGQFDAFRNDYRQWSPELQLEYRASDGSRYSIRALRGYNAGGAFSSASFAGEPFWIFYQPEQVRTGELGWQFGTKQLRVSATAFYSSLRDQWTAEQGGAFISDVRNSGRSSSYGLEIEGDWEVAPGHRLDFSLGWLQSRYRRYTPFERDALFEPVAGNQFAGAPDHSGSLTWRSDLGNRWNLNLAASYHGAVQANANNLAPARIPGVVLLESRLAWKMGRWTVAGQVYNLLNRDYHKTTPNLSRRTGRVDYLPGLPRTFGLTVEVIF